MTELIIFARQDPPSQRQYQYRFVLSRPGSAPVCKDLMSQVCGSPGLICSSLPGNATGDDWLKFQHADFGKLVVDIFNTNTGQMFSNTIEGGNAQTKAEFYKHYNLIKTRTEMPVGYLDDHLHFHEASINPRVLFPGIELDLSRETSH